MPKTYQGPIIAVRPRVGSALERIFATSRRTGEGMKEFLHNWAEDHESRSKQNQEGSEK